MKIDNLSAEIIETFEVEDIIDCMFKSIETMKPITEQIIDLAECNDDDKTIIRADFATASKKIHCDLETGIFQLPFYDSRSERRSLNAKEKKNGFPMWHHFVYINPELSTRPFGLVEMTLTGLHIPFNARDYQFDGTELIFKETRYFYYNYEQGVFKQVDSKKLEDAKKKLNKGQELDDDLDRKVSIYLERERTLNMALSMLAKTSEDFLDKLYVRLDENDMNKRNSVVDCKQIEGSLKQYESFFKKSVPQGLKLYLLFECVDRDEYEKLVEKNKQLVTSLAELREEFETLVEEEVEERLKSDAFRYSIEKKTEEAIRNEVLKLKPNTELESKANSVITSVIAFLTSNKDDKTKLDGWIDYDLTKMKLYPTLGQVEYRRCLTDKKINAIDRRDIELYILNNYQERLEKKFGKKTTEE